MISLLNHIAVATGKRLAEERAAELTKAHEAALAENVRVATLELLEPCPACSRCDLAVAFSW